MVDELFKSTKFNLGTVWTNEEEYRAKAIILSDKYDPLIVVFGDNYNGLDEAKERAKFVIEALRHYQAYLKN